MQGARAAEDVPEDLQEGSLLRATVHAALLSAIPFGIASIGMLVSPCSTLLHSSTGLSPRAASSQTVCCWKETVCLSWKPSTSWEHVGLNGARLSLTDWLRTARESHPVLHVIDTVTLQTAVTSVHMLCAASYGYGLHESQYWAYGLASKIETLTIFSVPPRADQMPEPCGVSAVIYAPACAA